jgi:signal transduction histidine kinase/DNA-binding response OmpR family regulator
MTASRSSDLSPETSADVSADAEAGLHRLRQFFLWDFVSLGAGLLLVGVAYAVLRASVLPPVAVALAAYGLLLLWARRLAERRRIVASLVTVCVGLWCLNPLLAWYLPAMFPFLGMLTLWPVVVPLPFITGRPLKRIMAVTTAVALLSAEVASLRPQPDTDRLPAAVVHVTLIVAVPLLVGLVSLVLWQYSVRLNEILQRTRAANQALRDSERSLEEKVRQRTHELLEAHDAALAATRAKSTFLANMSHELRTPLNAVLGYSEMLQEEAAEQGKPDFIPDLQRIHTAGKHLLTLINDVLDLSKVESGRMDLSLETFSISGLVREVTEVVRPLVRAGVRLEVRLDGTLDSGYADPTKVKQALTNLLSNACKFTERGSITLEVGQSGETADPGRRLWFRVSDTGIGMSVDELARIFQPFSQGSAVTARQYGGTGLGLAISRRFCQLMGGDITVSSERGRGSTLTLWIPAVVSVPAAPDAVRAVAATLAAAPPPPPGRARTVLVVDDDAPTRDLLRRFLEKEGHEVHIAADGEEGLKLARRVRPDLITLDVMMPRLDGWSLLALLKQEEGLADIPVILLTILDHRDHALARGALELLTKPIDRERLVAVVTRHARRPPGARALLLVDDDPGVRGLLRRMLEPQGWTVSEAENGQVALEHLGEHRPDIILLDLMMPTLDGFGFLEGLRGRAGADAAPVVVLTAKDLTDEDRRRLGGCVTRVLRKSELSEERVVQEISEALSGPRRAVAGGPR